MKKIIFFAFLFFLVSFLGAQDLTFTWSFDMPLIQQDDEGYTQLIYPECRNYGEEGAPSMPWLGVNLILPQGTEATQIKVLSVTWHKPVQDIVIHPAERQFPLSQIQNEPYQVVPDLQIYTSTQPWPAEMTDHLMTHFLSGHSIGSFTLCPVKYIPAANTIECIKEITVQITAVPGPRANDAAEMLRTSQKINTRIERVVDNPEYVKTYSYPEAKTINEYDILFITKGSLSLWFQSYLDYKASTGFIIKTIAVEDIYNAYAGLDNQDKIRNCIKDYYQNFGIDYVILAGDADPNNAADKIIPHRGFYANAYSTPDEDVPADIYYSNLDGNWNNDGDNRWGEPGEDDLYSEVSIGRICIDNSTEIQNATNKLKKYQNEPVVADIEKALMVGELLWNDPTWGGDYKDEVAYGSSNHGYTTVGLPGNYTITRLYEKLGNWSKTDIFNQFNNQGINMLNHLGHSNVNYNMKMYNTDITTTNFQNNGVSRGFVITYSQGCYNGSFDNRNDGGSYSTDDCFNEKFTTLQTGAVAAIGNSRYGWGQHSSTDGASQYFDRQFYDAVYGEGITHIGDANTDSKEDNVAYISAQSGAIRWCFYEINLFGDPTMDIWTAVPTAITATYQPSVPLGTTQISFQTNVPFGRVGIMQDNQLIGRVVLGADGNGTVTLFDPVTQVDDLSVSITGHNKIRHQGTIFVISNEPYVIYNSYLIDDSQGNSNGMVDYDETIALGMELANVGNMPAQNVTVTLTTGDPYITITDNTEYFGDFAAGQLIEITEAFAFDVANLIPDGHTANFEVQATGQSLWTSFFSITLHAPFLEAGNMTIDDAAGGNGNGMLDPGESVDLYVELTNSGSAYSPICPADLTTTSPWINIVSGMSCLGSIPPATTVSAFFQIVVDPLTPIGTSVDLTFLASAQQYGISETYYKTVGLVLEDWESGDFSKFGWETGGNAPWTIVTQSPYEGTYCAKSGNIGDNQSTSLAIMANVTTAGNISFYRKVSTESGYDFLYFYIDGMEKGSWAGTVAWGEVSYPVTAGQHTFLWKYVKDANTIGGSDCAWIDYIVFPALGPIVPVTLPYSTHFDYAGALPEGWFNSLADNMDWTPDAGGTPTNNTGPAGDHTTGSGYYVYTESSSPNYPSKTAQLVTPLFDFTTLIDAQLTFWYHMYGTAMGSLHLDIYANGAWTNDIMTAISGNQGNQWLQKTVD
ncbi:MAG: hypothetical protein JXA03_00830, partial [Bacteroidales bacterium]|nr:hypothetical protein [Bacteroidales bacterium]